MKREVNPQVYELYLKGSYYLNNRRRTPWRRGWSTSTRRSRGSHRRLAYAGLADGYITLAHGADPPRMPSCARRQRRDGVELDGSLPQESSPSAPSRGTRNGTGRRNRALRRAIELNPALRWRTTRGVVPRASGADAGGDRRAHQGARSRSAEPASHAWLGELYRWNGQYDLAIAEARKSIELNPKFPPAISCWAGRATTKASRTRPSKPCGRRRGKRELALGAGCHVREGRADGRGAPDAGGAEQAPVRSWTALWRGPCPPRSATRTMRSSGSAMSRTTSGRRGCSARSGRSSSSRSATIRGSGDAAQDERAFS